MDPVAGIDEHEDFFQRYDAEQVSQAFPEPEPEAAPTPPSEDELARVARFRKPVALLVGAMALFSLTALALRSAQPAPWVPSAPGAAQALVAHYAAAHPAAALVVNASTARPTAYEPVTWEALCAGPSMCLLDANADRAWLSVALAESEDRVPALSIASANNAELQRPILTSSLGSHFTASVHLAPAAHVDPTSSTPLTVRSAPRAAVTAPPQAVPIAPIRAAVAAPPKLALTTPSPVAVATPPKAALITPSRAAVATSPRAVFPAPQTAPATPAMITPVARFPDAQ